MINKKEVKMYKQFIIFGFVTLIVLFSFFIRAKSVFIIIPLLKDLLRKKAYVREADVLMGISSLLLSFGFALNTIIWLSFKNLFKEVPTLLDIVTFVLLAFVLGFAYNSYIHFNKAFFTVTTRDKKRINTLIKLLKKSKEG